MLAERTASRNVFVLFYFIYFIPAFIGRGEPRRRGQCTSARRRRRKQSEGEEWKLFAGERKKLT